MDKVWLALLKASETPFQQPVQHSHNHTKIKEQWLRSSWMPLKEDSTDSSGSQIFAELSMLR